MSWPIVFVVLLVVIFALTNQKREQFKLQQPLGAPAKGFVQGLWDGLVLEPAWRPDWPLDPAKNALPATNFAQNRFAMECCPNEPRNSDGCACLTGTQRWLLRNRGGNGV